MNMSDFLTGGLTNGINASSRPSQSTDALKNKLDGADLSKATDEELMAVCKDFEAYFVEQMFKSMERMSHIMPDEEDKGGAMSSGYATQMQDYFKDELITQYSKKATETNGGSGLGIASMLYEQMKRNYQI